MCCTHKKEPRKGTYTCNANVYALASIPLIRNLSHACIYSLDDIKQFHLRGTWYADDAWKNLASFTASPFSVLCHTVNKIKYGKNWRNKERKNEPSKRLPFFFLCSSNYSCMVLTLFKTEKGRPAKEARKNHQTLRQVSPACKNYNTNIHSLQL